MTTYEWEAELEGLGWLQSECLADSLKGQSNKKQKTIQLTCKFLLSKLKNTARTFVMQAHLRGVH